MAYFEITGLPLRHATDEFGTTVNLSLEKGRGLTVLSDDGELPGALADAIFGRGDFSGEIMLNGMRIDPMPLKDRSVSVLGEVPGIVPGRTVRQNLEVALHSRAMSVGEEVFLIDEELGTPSLAGLADSRAEALDAIGATILAAERIVLAGCDLILIRRLPVPPARGEREEGTWRPGMHLDALLELKSLFRRHRATWINLLTDPACVHILSDHVAIFSKGTLVQEGPLKAALKAPATRLVADFLAFPRMNYRTVEVQRDGPFVMLRSGRYGFRVGEYIKRHAGMREGETVVMGLRPEDVGIRPYQTGDPSVMNLAKIAGVDSIPGGQVVRLDADGEEWLALVEPGRPVFTGQLVELRPDPDNIHMFHPTTGASLLD